MVRKLIITAKELKKTAYHHYGNNFLSLFKFVYYSILRINRFNIYENKFSQDEVLIKLDPEYKIVVPSLSELNKIREGEKLPREFYYDRIHKLKKCYLAFKGKELAYIHWVQFKGDHSRFLVLGDNVAELNYNTTLPSHRGKYLSAKMMSYISKDLKKHGIKKVMGVIHEKNLASIKTIEKAGFSRVGVIKALGPFNKKMEITVDD